MAATSNGNGLHGQWALVTGAGKRIGAAIATALHEAGANVVIHYRGSAAGANKLTAALNEARIGSAMAMQADLNQTDQLSVFVEQITEQTGGLGILVNNASSFYPTPLGSVTEAQWNDLIGSNLKAPLFLSQAALPHLKKAGGVIINLIDIHAQRPLRDHPVYGSAKAGLAMLTRSLARDLGPQVRVNGVAPGAILWPDSGVGEKAKASIIRQIALKREGEPEDVARAVLFLVRDAPYVTGQIINVDGGRSIGW